MTELPSEVTYGRVVARWLTAVADTSGAEGGLDAVPANGKVTFTRLDLNTVVLDTLQNDGTFVGIARRPIVGELDSTGELAAIDAEVIGLPLITGRYSVSPSVEGVNWPAFEIEVTAEHTSEKPLDLLLAISYAPPIGITVQTLLVPGNGVLNQYLGSDGSGGLKWDDVSAAVSAYLLDNPPQAEIAVPDADATTLGIVALAGDLGGTASLPRVPGLSALNDTADLALLFENGLI